MTIEIFATILVNKSLKGFGHTIIRHKETSYLLAEIDTNGRLIAKGSPHLFLHNEVRCDPDIGNAMGSTWVNVDIKDIGDTHSRSIDG